VPFSWIINNLLKEFKRFAIDLERPINDILEEAMKDFLEKHGKVNPKQLSYKP
jgi:hypothetical protein